MTAQNKQTPLPVEATEKAGQTEQQPSLSENFLKKSNSFLSRANIMSYIDALDTSKNVDDRLMALKVVSDGLVHVICESFLKKTTSVQKMESMFNDLHKIHAEIYQTMVTEKNRIVNGQPEKLHQLAKITEPFAEAVLRTIKTDKRANIESMLSSYSNYRHYFSRLRADVESMLPGIHNDIYVQYAARVETYAIHHSEAISQRILEAIENRDYDNIKPLMNIRLNINNNFLGKSRESKISTILQAEKLERALSDALQFEMKQHNPVQTKEILTHMNEFWLELERPYPGEECLYKKYESLTIVHEGIKSTYSRYCEKNPEGTSEWANLMDYSSDLKSAAKGKIELFYLSVASLRQAQERLQGSIRRVEEDLGLRKKPKKPKPRRNGFLSGWTRR